MQARGTSPDVRLRRSLSMALSGHLRELRQRLMISACGLLVGMVIACVIIDPVIHALSAPIQALAREHDNHLAALNFDTVTSAFDLRLRISFALGILLSAPVWLWQIWAFIMPAMTSARFGTRWGSSAPQCHCSSGGPPSGG